MINYIHIFFLSKGPSYIDVGVLNEKISQVNVTTKNLIFKLHLLLNTICCTRPLNPRCTANSYEQTTKNIEETINS
jgi:hypothetical protein